MAQDPYAWARPRAVGHSTSQREDVVILMTASRARAAGTDLHGKQRKTSLASTSPS